MEGNWNVCLSVSEESESLMEELQVLFKSEKVDPKSNV